MYQGASLVIDCVDMCTVNRQPGMDPDARLQSLPQPRTNPSCVTPGVASPVATPEAQAIVIAQVKTSDAR